MKKFIFEMEFLSDIVLPATSNTEGNIEYLDFVPGSNFLGMAASTKYDYENSFEIFHSGKVRFGDAKPLIDGRQTYSVPFSYFHEKLDDTKIYNHHLITDFSGFKQLKQKRDGYITDDKKFFEVEYDYSQKSSYDRENRRSKDSSMFGYRAIKKGAIWQFNLSYDESVENIQEVKSSLLGEKRLGKSKSSQYGLVHIKEAQVTNDIENISNTQEVVLYANSRLALIDSNGNPSLDLSDLDESLTAENILWQKCQIRTSSFTPFNSKREIKDYERSIIKDGSVIVLKDISDKQLNSIKSGVGAYLSEGFGEVLINPNFLQDEKFKKEEIEKKQSIKTTKKRIESSSKHQTVNFLINRHNKKYDDLKIANDVQEFIDKHGSKYDTKMNSQWGTIRSLCSSFDDEGIIKAIEDYTSKGVAKDIWSGGKQKLLTDAIEEQEYKIAFTKLLSMQMPKQNQGDKS